LAEDSRDTETGGSAAPAEESAATAAQAADAGAGPAAPGMRIDIVHERPAEDAPRGGPVRIGWLLKSEAGGVLYDPPERVRSADVNRAHAKSASRCPAVINLESRFFAVKCPFDLHLGFTRDREGKPALRNLAGAASPIRTAKINEKITLVAEKEWRYPDRPTIQLRLPYIFLADEPVWMSQVAPFMHLPSKPWPGTLFGGRMPIHLWPRPLMWAFEWRDTKAELVLKRGEPLFYCMFETIPPDRAVQMVEVERTPELERYIEFIGGAVNYVNQTFSLFEAAERARPTRLVEPRRRD
jgi:hypothetical protein